MVCAHCQGFLRFGICQVLCIHLLGSIIWVAIALLSLKLILRRLLHRRFTAELWTPSASRPMNITSCFTIVMVYNSSDRYCELFFLLTSHTRLTALLPGLSGWAGTRKVKPVWILLKQETLSGSGISWAICKSASRSRQITMPVPHHSSFFYRPDALPAAKPTASKHWRQFITVVLETT